MFEPSFSCRLLDQFEFAQRLDEPALVTSQASLSARAILGAGRALAARIGEIRRADPSADGLMIPSSDPVTFVIGLVACELADCCAIPWMDAKIPQEAIADLARPAMLLEKSGQGEPALRVLPGPRLAHPRQGNLIMTTSGSTGTPKGVALELSALLLNATATGASIGVQRCKAWVIDLDFALMSALCHLIMAWRFGLPLVNLGDMAPAEFRSGVHGNFGVGGSPLQLIRLDEKLPEGLSPQILVSSGDFLTPEMTDLITARYPACEVHKLYGMTELAGRFCHMPHRMLMQHKAAAGYPLAGYQARVREPDENNYGEIEARSALMMHGYYLAGGVFDRFEPEWLRTGDFGTIDRQGAVTLAGRSDDVLKVGGEKVDRFTVETTLSDLLLGFDYCVLPVEHHLLGRCLALFLSQAPSRTMPSRAAIIERLRQSLPNRFIPPLTYSLPQPLPRLSNGKLDRQSLVRRHAELQRLA